MSTENSITKQPTNMNTNTPSTTDTTPSVTSGSTADVKHATQRQSATWTYRPDADILHSEDAFTIVLDMPGVSTDDVEVTVENSTLIVHGRVGRPAIPEGATVIRNEYGVGNYLRRFEFNDSIDRDQITAECAGGVLTVRLPKVAAARPRRIDVAVRDRDSAS